MPAGDNEFRLILSAQDDATKAISSVKAELEKLAASVNAGAIRGRAGGGGGGGGGGDGFFGGIFGGALKTGIGVFATIKSIGEALSVAADISRLWRGEIDSVWDVLERLPFGLKKIASAIKELGGFEWAKEAEKQQQQFFDDLQKRRAELSEEAGRLVSGFGVRRMRASPDMNDLQRKEFDLQIGLVNELREIQKRFVNTPLAGRIPGLEQEALSAFEAERTQLLREASAQQAKEDQRALADERRHNEEMMRERRKMEDELRKNSRELIERARKPLMEEAREIGSRARSEAASLAGLGAAPSIEITSGLRGVAELAGQENLRAARDATERAAEEVKSIGDRLRDVPGLLRDMLREMQRQEGFLLG